MEKGAAAPMDIGTMRLHPGRGEYDNPVYEAEDSGDPLIETDRRMRYGWYKDAADCISEAIQSDPSRADFKLKLFEVLFVWGDVKLFRQAINDHADSLRGQPEWDKVKIMATEVLPDENILG